MNSSLRLVNQQDDLSSSTQALLAKVNSVKRLVEDPIPGSKETRVIFCSRTHSQLSQFVQELRRVKPPSSTVSFEQEILGISSPSPDEESVKHLSLGSRKNLCINHKVSRLDSVKAINERCLDLQKVGVPEEQKCPFLPRKDDEGQVNNFRDHALAEVHDIEDLSNLGRSMGVCPYYASRPAIESTEILTLPYPLLLQKSAREALGVSVKDHVVIVDEAHNLMDAIADTYSCSISLRQIETATSHVMVYAQQFKNRLKGKNRMYVAQIIRLLTSISQCLRSVASDTPEREVLITPARLLAGKGVDQIQPHKLIRYLQESKLAHKVEDYIQFSDDTARPGATGDHDRGALQLFQSFLAVLMNPSAEGRFFLSKDGHDHIHIRYTLLDPREHFRDIVEEARAVVLAGGTMSPMSDYRDYLFSYLPADRLRTFSFGHVVPPENLFAQSVSTGPSGVELDFTFEKRKSEKMLAELGLLFVRACRVIPDGVVAFFPSYDFLSHVVSVWKRTPLPDPTLLDLTSPSTQIRTTIYAALNAIKPIFHETKPRSNEQNQPRATDTILDQASPFPVVQRNETLLQSYTRTIDQSLTSEPLNGSGSDGGNGALLLSVISGNLSEGINFSDRLGRAVLAVGLPYPNPHSALWKAKIQHVETTYLKTHSNTTPAESAKDTFRGAPNSISSSLAIASEAKRAGREYYKNTALRSVNQAIGRVIRHKQDYAAVLLIDRRFEAGEVRAGLPGWIGRAVEKGRERKGWLETEEGLKGFFESKRNR